MDTMKEEMIAIDAPYFYAGLVLINQDVIYAAPIIHYMKGWKLQRVISYTRKKGWRWMKVDTYAETQTKQPVAIKVYPRDKRTNNNIERRRSKNYKSLH